jgi:hypothetical protein
MNQPRRRRLSAAFRGAQGIGDYGRFFEKGLPLRKDLQAFVNAAVINAIAQLCPL